MVKGTGTPSAVGDAPSTNSTSSSEVEEKPWHQLRLSPHIKPTLYSLWLHPNLVKGTFDGRVTISLDVDAPVPCVSVHIKGLQISKSNLQVDDDSTQQVKLKNCFEYVKNEFWVCEPEELLAPRKYKLSLEFSGTLTDKIVGFYRSTYRDVSGEERAIATTKFEPTFARQAFPCFDEPDFKAKYDIELVKPAAKKYIALSNMPSLEEKSNFPQSGLTTVKFSTMHPMSSYLACFIVCDFDSLEPVTANHNFPITVYARKEFVSDTKLARDCAVQFADFYCDYFNVTYPLPKLDLIAIPDFVSGAMENWGLITFREARLICDVNNTSIATQLSIALTVAHEISHMWFGNLVTMKWWQDLWLNEGFATFMEYKAVAQKYPAWDLDTVFVDDELYSVLKEDAALSSHPIIVPVNSPDEITEIFDFISYAKGASIIRMLEKTVGENEFRAAISSYLNKYKYANAKTENLWDELDAHSHNMNVTSFMDTWTRQMGYPVINVAVDKGKNEAVFSQKRFLLDSEAEYDPSTSPYGYKWEVPITYVTSNNAKIIHTAWLKKSDKSISVPLEENVDWLKVNYHHVNYYIVNYEESMWDNLNAILEKSHKTFDAIDRANLLFDSFMLAEAGQLGYVKALNGTKYLSHDNHYLPWSVALTQFAGLNKRLYGLDGHGAFKKYIRSITKDLRALTWEVNDDAGYTNKTLQRTILELGCMVENETCLNQAATLFKQWLTEPSMKLHPELASIILYYGVQRAGENEWEKLWEIFAVETDPQKKMKMMRSLTATKEAHLITRLLERGKNESVVRSQDYLNLIIHSGLNLAVNHVVWKFVRDEWPYLVKRYTTNDRNLGRVIPSVTAYSSTQSQLEELKEFFKQYPEAGAGEKARKRAAERIENNIKWRSKHLPTITDWLKSTVAELPDDV